MNDRTIKVTGTASITGSPDWVVILFNINSSDYYYTKSVEQLAKQTEALKRDLMEAGFEKDALKTSSFHIGTDYEWVNNNSKKVFRGYVASHSLKIEFSFDKKVLNNLLNILGETRSEANFNIQFTIKDTEALKELALAEAVKNSKKKAELLTEAAGVSLGELLKIDYSWGEVRFRSSTTFDCCEYESDNVFDIVPDDISVSDSVTVIWSLK